MSKWIVVLTENGVLKRIVFDGVNPLVSAMKPVVDAAQLWDFKRFCQWARNAKEGQWMEMRDETNCIRALVVKSSDPKTWQVNNNA